MSSQEGYFLLSLTCAKCSLPVWVNFFAGPVSGPKVFTDLSTADWQLTEKPAITTNEVIDFHQFIRKFNGNFKRQLKRGR